MSNLREDATKKDRPMVLASLAAELLTDHTTEGEGGATVFTSDLARETFETVTRTGGELVGEFEFSVLVKKDVARRSSKE